MQTQLNELDKIHDGYYDKTVSVRKKFADLCDNTNFTEDLIGQYILFRRTIINPYKLDPLEKELSEALRIEIIKQFQEQNKNLI